MTAEELLFFDAKPQFLPLYRSLREALERLHPELTVKVSKTQISLRNRHVFACVCLPGRRGKAWPADCLLLSFGLAYRRESPRILQAVEAYPRRWTHHVPLTEEAQLDPELLAWLEEAFAFANAK